MADVRWPRIRQSLAALSPAQLLDLLHELHDRSADNRRYLAAKVNSSDGAAALQDYRERIDAEFVHGNPPRQPRLGAARKAIRDYQRATGDRDGAADLLLSFVESGNRLSREHGDMGSAFYDSLARALHDLGEVLHDDRALYGRLRQRLAQLRRDSQRVGWTWGAHVAEIVDRLERAAGDD